jgi:hypothetical protein
LVVIDHLGVDHTTVQILSEYGALGVHVWHCKGAAKFKSNMWSDVTRVYKDTSDFVFPIDSDELLSVMDETTPPPTHTFSWNQKTFDDEIESLLQYGASIVKSKRYKRHSGHLPKTCNR